ncbi:MAG: methylated-DNA--[protein]-cysteine S-methyltransferase [Oscillospiraceae bacterium]|nr:methylated-DNA--[protein]-cysteine S-methyltransferase [Oscillospiraceae bacterium]
MKNAFNYFIYETEYGNILVESDGSAITKLKTTGKIKPTDIKPIGEKRATALTDKAALQLREYFIGKRREFDLPLKPHGTDFQRSVWNVLCDIPYGETRTYKQIAETINNPKACRAVGMANNKNPIWIIIPCHRVIGADGALTGYGGGLEMKQRLLEIEKGKDTVTI